MLGSKPPATAPLPVGTSFNVSGSTEKRIDEMLANIETMEETTRVGLWLSLDDHGRRCMGIAVGQKPVGFWAEEAPIVRAVFSEIARRTHQPAFDDLANKILDLQREMKRKSH